MYIFVQTTHLVIVKAGFAFLNVIITHLPIQFYLLVCLIVPNILNYLLISLQINVFRNVQPFIILMTTIGLVYLPALLVYINKTRHLRAYKHADSTKTLMLIIILVIVFSDVPRIVGLILLEGFVLQLALINPCFMLTIPPNLALSNVLEQHMEKIIPVHVLIHALLDLYLYLRKICVFFFALLDISLTI